jgi:hypothetical protein
MKLLFFEIFTMIAFAEYEQIQIQSQCCIHQTTRNQMINHMELEGYTFLNSTLTLYNQTCESLLYFQIESTYMPTPSQTHSPSPMPTHGPIPSKSDTNEPTPYLSYDLISM